MTQKLIELFDLPTNTAEPETEPEVSTQDMICALGLSPEDSMETAMTTLEKIEAALPQVTGLDSADSELDDLAKMATDSFAELSDLGMQVDSRFAGEIFSVASSMLGHAITAKTAKINKKLKMLDAQVKLAQLAAKKESQTQAVTSVSEGVGTLLDRNELLRKARGEK